MLTPTDPVLKVTLTGTNVTSISNENTWTLGNKVEESYSIAISSSVTPTFANVTNPVLMIINGDGAFDLVINDGVNDIILPGTATFPIMLNIDEDFVANYTISLANQSTTDTVGINFRVFGEEITE